MTVNAWAVFDALVLVYWVGVALLIISEDREPTAAIAWLLVLFALPFVGLVFYFFLGRNWPAITQKSQTTRETQRLVDAFMPTVYAPAAEKVCGVRVGHRPRLPHDDRAPRRAQDRRARSCPCARCDLYGSGAEYFDTLIADISGGRALRPHAVLHLEARRAHRAHHRGAHGPACGRGRGPHPQRLRRQHPVLEERAQRRCAGPGLMWAAM